MKYKFQKTILALSVSAILSACGGGGGGGSPAIDASLSGKAAKGIVINGLVVAKELDNTGAVLREVGSATTGSDGSYSLDLDNSYEGGLIEIMVTSGPDTTTVCDVVGGCGTRTDTITDSNTTIDFSEQYKPSSLSMTALLPDAEDGESIAVQVTPFTHMAAERAKANATLDSNAINDANSEVSDLLGGIDILRTEPVDITDSASLNDAGADAQVYAALAAAIANLAPTDADGQPDIDQALSDLTVAFSTDGTFAADDLQDIVDEAANTFDEVGATDTSGVLAELQEDVDASAGGDIDPEPNENAGDTDVEKAKAFLADLRTWGTVIGDELDAPSAAFENQIELSDAAADMILNDDVAGDAIVIGADVIADIADGIADAGILLTDYPTDYGLFTGTVFESSANGHTTYTTTNASVNVDGDTASLNMVVIVPEEGQSVTTITLGIQSFSAEGDDTRWVVNSGTIEATLPSAYTVDFSDLAPEPPVPDSVSLDLDVAFTQKKTVVNEQVVDATDPVTFAGNLAMTLYPYADPVTDEILDAVPGSFTMGGNVSNTTGDSVDMNLSVSIPDAETFAANPVSVIDDEVEFFDETQPLVGTVGLQFTAQFDGLPEADISITGNATDFEQGNATVTISYGARSIELTASNDTADDEKGSVVITNQDGVVLTLDFDNLEDEDDTNDISNVTINNKVVATLEELDNGASKVSYIDGTFEIF